MRSATLDKSGFRQVVLSTLVAAWAFVCPAPAEALVVQDMTGTTVAPADDPGWNFVTGSGSRSYVYLGNGWAMSAFHVGVPAANEPINFPGGTFHVIPNQAFAVKNPAGSGLSADTDLRLIRINGDPGTPLFTIASQQLFESSTPLAQRDVVIIGSGPTRLDNQSQWNVEVVSGSNNDVWTEVFSPQIGTYQGFRSVTPDDDVKRWGTNRIADEDPLFGGGDNDFRGTLQLKVAGANRDIVSMITQFDSPSSGGLTNEAQVVAGDSGSAVFYKRNGQWELIGVVNALYSTIENQNTSFAVYGNYTTFADMSYYHDEIMSIINAHPYNLVMGDVNLDGIVGGDGTGPVATDDVSAFVAGWLYDNGTGVGTYASWLNGDLSGDGKTDVADFFLLRSALNPAGTGAGLSLGSLVVGGVPEPSCLLLAMAGAAFLACSRRRPRLAATH